MRLLSPKKEGQRGFVRRGRGKKVVECQKKKLNISLESRYVRDIFNVRSRSERIS